MRFLATLLMLTASYDITAGDDFANCNKFKAIAESVYDRRPSSADDPSKRPLGFWFTTIPFVTNNPNAENPCFTISLDNSSSQTVEVLAHSAVGSSSFCVKSEPAYAQPTCQSGIKTCQDSPIGHDSIKYVFYCEGCETDLQIWIRITVSPSFTNGLDFEYWCQREAEYPNSLIALPHLVVTTAKPTSKAGQVSFTSLWIVFVSFALLQVHAL